MFDMGIPIADATIVTQSMWEAAYDGLHYLRGSNDNWNGHISTFVFQVWGIQMAFSSEAAYCIVDAVRFFPPDHSQRLVSQMRPI